MFDTDVISEWKEGSSYGKENGRERSTKIRGRFETGKVKDPTIFALQSA
jgi:hypothetical protein